MRTQIFGTLITWSIVGVSAGDCGRFTAEQPCRPGVPILRNLAAASVEAGLESLRPIPISSEEKRRALSSLPPEGELQPTADEAAKLGSLQRVLIYHKRQDVFEAKVIDLPQAGIVLLPARSC